MLQFYLALTFWLMVALLQAYAIFKLWQGLVRPRWINLVLLPGTVVAETANFVAAMLTGAPVREARLVSDEPLGEGPDLGADAKKGVPILSPLLMALLPILAGLGIIYVLYVTIDNSSWPADSVVKSFASDVSHQDSVARQVGQTAMVGSGADDTSDHLLAQKLDWRLGSWFDLGRDVLTMSQRMIRALPFRDPQKTWPNWLFIYLTACLAIRMVPLRGNLRGGMAAVVLVGVLAYLLGLIKSVHQAVSGAWTLLAFVIGLLTTLLLLTLLIRGVVALGFVLADKPQPTRG